MTRESRAILRIGIASAADTKARTLAIARGEMRPGPEDPRIWFPSTESLGKILSARNRELLALIRRAAPDSLRALADLSSRELSNLSRTLRTMERYGLVRLERLPGGRVRPTVHYEDIIVTVRIGEPVPLAA